MKENRQHTKLARLPVCTGSWSSWPPSEARDGSPRGSSGVLDSSELEEEEKRPVLRVVLCLRSGFPPAVACWRKRKLMHEEDQLQDALENQYAVE